MQSNDKTEDHTFRNELYQLVKNYEYPFYNSRVDAILLHPKDFDRYRIECMYQYFPDNDIRFMGIPLYSVYAPTLKEGEPMLLTNHLKGESYYNTGGYPSNNKEVKINK